MIRTRDTKSIIDIIMCHGMTRMFQGAYIHTCIHVYNVGIHANIRVGKSNLKGGGVWNLTFNL